MRGSVDPELEMQKISHTFGSLLSKIQRSLENQGITVDAFITHLKTVRALEPTMMYSERPLVHACMEHIQLQKSVEDIFPLISGYQSWFNHIPVEKMVEAFCKRDEEVRSANRTFKSQFEDFCIQMVTDCPKHGFGFERTKDAEKIVVNFDTVGGVAKVSELVSIRNIVALHIRVKKQALYVSSVESGLTLKVTFLAPLFVVEAAFPLREDQEKLLNQCGVLQIECGEYQYFSPSWSRECEFSIKVCRFYSVWRLVEINLSLLGG